MVPVTAGNLVTVKKDDTMVSAINVIQGGNVLHGICYSDKDMYVGCSSATGSVY